MLKKIYKKIISEKKRIKIRLTINKLLYPFYIGNTYTCNVCGKSARKFKSKGSLTIRKNAVCPYCNSLERTRLLLFYLKNETNIFTKNTSLLHIAPEWELKKIFKQYSNIHYVNGDLNPNYADEQMDITKIPYSDNFFDYIICSHVLGHVPDEDFGVQEMSRVLKKDGIALIFTLIDWNNPYTYEDNSFQTPQERLKYYSEPDLLRLHGTDFSKRLEKNGFNVEVINYAEILGKEFHQKYSLGDGNRETFFKCTKKSW